MGQFRDAFEEGRARWGKIKACPKFIEPNDETTFSLGYDVEVGLFLSLEYLEWCVEHCNGQFFRRQTANTIFGPRLTCMTFSDPADAVHFKLVIDSVIGIK